MGRSTPRTGSIVSVHHPDVLASIGRSGGTSGRLGPFPRMPSWRGSPVTRRPYAQTRYCGVPARGSGGWTTWANASTRVFQPGVLRGWLFSTVAIASRSSRAYGSDRCPSGSTGAATRSCSRFSAAAADCVGREDGEGGEGGEGGAVRPGPVRPGPVRAPAGAPAETDPSTLATKRPAITHCHPLEPAQCSVPVCAECFPCSGTRPGIR